MKKYEVMFIVRPDLESEKVAELVKHLILIASGSVKGYPVFRKDAMGQNLVGQIYNDRSELLTDMSIASMVQTEKKTPAQLFFCTLTHRLSRPLITSLKNHI